MAARQLKTKVTTDHDEIRRWVMSMGGKPARVKGTGRGDDPGILRIEFPRGVGSENLDTIAWGDWLAWFDDNQLAFLYEEKIPFAKLVARETVADKLGRAATTGRARGAKRATPNVPRSEGRRVEKGRGKKKTTARRTSTSGDGATSNGARRTTTKRGTTGTRRSTKRTTLPRPKIGTVRSKAGAKRKGAKTTAAKRGAKRAAR